MRASLSAHLRAAIASGHFARLARGAVRAAAARFDLALPGRLAGPLLATFAITYRCPLACGMCDLPTRAHSELSDTEILEFVDAIADLKPLGLGFTGGEPLLRDVLFPAIERSVARGIVTHLNTSGVGLSSTVARRLIAARVTSINVSIDHDVAAVHDQLRGRPRALEHALTALRRLNDARKGSRHPPRLQAMMAVSRESLSRVAAVRALALDHGADAVSLLPLHDFPPHRDAEPATPRLVARHGFGATTSPTAADAPLDLTRLPLENSERFLAGIEPFLNGARTPGPCSAKRSAVFLDPRGRVFSCTPGATLDHDGIPVTPKSLGAVVRSGALAKTVPREQCDRCWWNCHRELDIAIGRARMPAS